MIRNVIRWPDPILKTVSEPIAAIGVSDPFDRVATIVRKAESIFLDLVDTTSYHNAVGLAAVQIGEPVRVFTQDLGYGPEVYINPRIVLCIGDDRLMEEGCLSLPGIYEKVRRYTALEVHVITNLPALGGKRSLEIEAFSEVTMIVGVEKERETAEAMKAWAEQAQAGKLGQEAIKELGQKMLSPFLHPYDEMNPEAALKRAHAFQHEIDHLNGRLYMDLLSYTGRERVKRHMMSSRAGKRAA